MRGLAARSERWAGASPGADRAGVEVPFALWRASLRDGGGPIQSPPAAADPDARLWWALVSGALDACAVIDSLPEARRSTDRGAIFPQGLYRTIEVWTESELASLHALWWHGKARGDAAAVARMFDAARWHLDNTQPDNATNRPWGVQVFLELASIDANPDARLYAETLLHNANAANGVPDPFSAEILLDGADALEAVMNAE